MFFSFNEISVPMNDEFIMIMEEWSLTNDYKKYSIMCDVLGKSNVHKP